MTEWALPPQGGHLDRPSGIYLQTLAGRQLQERLKQNDLLIVPLGATENHGPPCPPGEDIFLVTRMAEMVADGRDR